MKKVIMNLLLLSLMLSCSSLEAVSPVLKSEVRNLAHCESVVFESSRNVFYVSVQGDGNLGDGYISKVSYDGKIIKLKFISGLNDPKGIAIYKNSLFVSDVNKLVEADLDTGKVINEYLGEKSEFLNDVTIDDKGNVYVSDMFTSSIYKLDRETSVFTIWMKSPKLENPNGLLVKGDYIYIAAWGHFIDKKPLDAPMGRFMKVNLKTKHIKLITSDVVGNLDGLQEYDESSFIVSDWVSGKISIISEDGTIEEVLNVEKSVGDIYYDRKSRSLVMPMNIQNRLLIYKI